MGDVKRRQWAPTPEEAAEILASMRHESAVQAGHETRQNAR